ncbi:methionine aminopeptidase [Meredithblackwellia eburnea MCA 4105]
MTVASGGVPCLNNCGKMGSRSFTCPKCIELGFRDGVFCSKECFVTNYKTHHKTMHKKPAVSTYNFPTGTHDHFPSDQHVYTGKLRAVYPDKPVPMREVPAHILKPDYATEVKGRSFQEQAARRMMGKFGKIHTKAEIESMRTVCKLAREVLDLAAATLRPGLTTLEIDDYVHKLCIERDSYPSPLNYRLFPRSVCTSINEVICHGIPDARPLEDGDIINLDVTLYHKGFHGDVNATYPVGNVSEENMNLIRTSRKCLDESIRICKPGTLFRDVGGVIEPVAKAQGFSTNRTYVGHGINQLFHPPPDIAHYANSKSTVGEMKTGMIFTIEPMICIGNQQDVHWPDNWTAVTTDGKCSAQFEETLLVTADGVEVLTAAPGWKLPEPDK